MKIDKIAALKRTALFGELTGAELAKIARRATTRHMSQGEMLFITGEPARGIFVIVRGTVRAFRQNADGREQVMHVETAGATIAEVPVFDQGVYPASAVAEQDSTILFISTEDMQAFLLQIPGLALHALKLLAKRLRRHAELVEDLSLHKVGQRLALFLYAEAQRSPGAIVNLTLSNQQIANRIGSVRDVISREMTQLRQQGLIAMKGRTIAVVNMQALKQYAERG